MPARWEPGAPSIDGASIGPVLEREPVVVLHFWAEWDGHDLEMDRRLGPIRAEFEGRACFRSADIDRPDLVPTCRAFGVVNVPTLVGIVRGRAAWTVVGLRPGAELRRLVADLIGDEDEAGGRLTPRPGDPSGAMPPTRSGRGRGSV